MRGKWLKLIGVFFIIVTLALAGCANSETKPKDDTQDDQNTDPGKEKDQDSTTEDSSSEGPLDPLAEPVTVTIAEDGSASGAGFYIAKERGYFEEYNINVEFVKFGNSDEMLPALAAGKIDVAGGISSASFFNSIAQGIDVRMIADKGHNVMGNSYFTFVLRKDLQDEIKDYKDLKGKRIAVSTKNAVDDYIFERMLEHAGLTRDDVEFTLMSDFGNMMSAIGNNQIAAALQIEPLITQGIEQDLHVKFGDVTDFAPKAQIAMVLGSPEFLNERREVALRFMAGYLKGVRDYNDVFVKDEGEKEEIINIMTEHTALKDPAIWNKVAVTGLNPDGRMFTEDIKKQYNMYKENGAIKGEVDFDKAVDPSLVEDVLDIIGEY
ncbi:ABC transporter substrate-binding protein [Virgibacillus salinus]|uniref:NitT/TauT family transport system substrate-binding protein n=1 Tax=Virgibacillus salinus TaxID=553311 RepID=A0A1H0Y0I2_9BACI|nr:ABC transporter substrate-binding protein [Virgibacillus salinus]SDQ08620.1 NitT/TauT family transport system substrate-binding protein [Virgibacillus salinus]